MKTKGGVVYLLVIMISSCTASRLPYIIGGSPVDDVTRHPWQGSLRVFGLHNCGCSLISSTWAITAAHCSGYSILFYDIRFGSIDRDDGGIIVVPDQVIVHEDWDEGPGSFPNDIALMHFSAVDLRPTISIISMTETDQAGNPDCYITGWGWMESGDEGSFPAILQEALVNVYTDRACKDEHGSSINPGHVCVGDPAQGKGSCKGDSGGPLVCRVNGMFELVGISSWAQSGCYTSRPAVYTRVAYFRDWVIKNTDLK